MNKEYILQLVEEEKWLEVFQAIDEKYRYSLQINTQKFEPYVIKVKEEE